MNLWNSIRGLFGAKEPRSTLRNKPGGLAWIKPCIEAGDGAGACAGVVVTTVRVAHDDVWVIEPAPVYTLTQATRYGSGEVFRAGQTVRFRAVRDRCLEPFKDQSKDIAQETREPVPREVIALTVREM